MKEDLMDNECEIGMIGLGVMGRNLLLNFADHGYAVAGYDTDAAKVGLLRGQTEDRRIYPAESLPDLVKALRKPRAVMILVPAGAPVAAVVEGLVALLEPGDVIIDGGNSHFIDTDRRAGKTSEKGVHFLGVGISGGEHGARHGPSIMPGGPPKAYERVRSVFEAAAARFEGEPCVRYLGPGSAGHYVKMVHNGIEYGLMRLIADTYDLMKRGLDLDDDELATTYEGWNQGKLSAYLLEITARIFRQVDDMTRQRLIDVILDESKQKGTGMWTSEDALRLGVPVPSIDMSVSMRFLSVMEEERRLASKFYDKAKWAVSSFPSSTWERENEGAQRSEIGVCPHFAGDRYLFMEQLRCATYAAMIIIYAQGMALLRRASQEYAYHLNLADVASVWRGGCIIRSGMLEEIRRAFEPQPDLKNLLLDPLLGAEVAARADDLRAVVITAVTLGVPVPAFMASLAYLDAYSSDWMAANLIEAQRDYFGAHTYERVDVPGTFHTEWEPD